jgi:flagellar biosynthesis chaperone FliJ
MNTNNEQELLSLYRENNSLREQLADADVMSMEKIQAITQAIDDLHQLIAKHRPSIEVACALDELIAHLEDSVR